MLVRCCFFGGLSRVTSKIQLQHSYSQPKWSGFLQSINGGAVAGDDLFALELRYDDPVFPGVGPQQNCNIAQMTWQVQGRDKQTYGFANDHLDRLKSATYGEYSGTALSVTGQYNTTYDYDKRGNLQNLTREGRYFDGSDWQVNRIDELSYQYLTQGGQATNQLGYVAESAPTGSRDHGFRQPVAPGNDYIYDDNGNLTSDPTKDIASISYNYLNLPQTISFADGRELSAVTLVKAGDRLYL